MLLASTTEWTVLYQHQDEFELADKNSLTTLPILPKEWRVSFDLMPTSMASNSTDWNSIFQMHVRGSNWPEVGCKIPEVHFDGKNQNKLKIQSAVNCETVNLGFDKMPMLKQNNWISIKIIQKLESSGIYRTKILIDDTLLYSTENKQPQTFEDVQVYASNSLTSGHSGRMKKLRITGRDLQGNIQSCPLKNLKVWRIFIVICCLNMKTNL